ncbi:hypothetical protein BamIOP4010DRAFT_0636 [Burkholderia ambifaria IOP40-10]|uniref:Uncharacterized protein n=1 Tax=Burkholderia ambifaria IOP40-10 TaxID=396596 RepID=B1F9C7_9BURK|nr:hypothetical protein [Burkholderia ambifaria]EDT05899.1 hypothetical protein BamIOP4010DRAFT_0636 [Burkholderia ambifaria IOP40-10]
MKKQTFTMRISESLVQAVEKIKGQWQESSTSEVARRLIELGLDADRRQREEHADLRSALLDDPRAALVQFRDRYYRNEPLQREEWAFIAQRVHDAYGRARRTFVTRAVLVDVLQATRALFIARTRHTGRVDYVADGYHRSKLNLRDDESLVDGIARVAAGLPAWPDQSYAEWLSRSFTGFFNGEEPDLPDAAIHEALAPYFDSLLGLAVRAYWVEKGEPIVAADSAFARPLTVVKLDDLSVQFMFTGQRLSAIVDFGDRRSMLLSLTSPPLIQDFFDLVTAATELADDDRSLPEYGAGPRRIGLPIKPYNKFILWDGDKNFHFDRPSMEQLARLVAEARANPEVAAHEKAARLAWGTI